MADGANLELKFTASQDESVRQAFTALTKLLETLNKRIGSLSSSIDKLVSNNSKLKKSTKGVSDQNEETAKSYKKKGDAAEKAAEKEKKAAEKAAKVAKDAADKQKKAADKQQRAIDNAAKKATATAEKEAKKQQRIRDTEHKKALKEADKLLKEKTRELEQEKKLNETLIKHREKIKSEYTNIKNNFGEAVTSKTYMTNVHDTFNMMDMYHRKLEQINREDKRGTITHGQKLIALQQTEDAFRKYLKPIDEALARKVRINDAIVKLTEIKDVRAAEGLSIAEYDKAIERLTDKMAKLDTITNRQAFAELSTTFDFNKQFEKNLKAVMKSRVFTEADKDIIKLAEHGQFAVDIYKRLTDGMADESAQRKIISKEVDKYGKDYHKTMNTLNADLRELIRLQGMVTSDDALWNDYNKRISEKYKQISELKNIVENPQLAFSTYNTKRSSVANEIDKITKYSTKVDNLGKSARVLFDELNKGLDKNSIAIDDNFKRVNVFFNKLNTEKRRLNAELLENERVLSETSDPKRIEALNKSRSLILKSLQDLETRYNSKNIIKTYNRNESGVDAIFKGLRGVNTNVSWVRKALQDIYDKTIVGSEEQRAAIGRLNDYWKQWVNTIDGARVGVRNTKAELAALKATGASPDAISGVEDKLREIRKANKAITSSFNNIDIMDNGVYKTFGKDFKRYAEGILQDENYFGKTARRLVANLKDPKEWASTIPQLEALSAAYNKVIPVIQRLIEVNGLSSDQAKQLFRDEFLKQVSLEKTTDGVRKAAEQQVGFNHVTRESVSIFDRMAASMGNMARYAIASTVYYSVTRAIQSAVAAVAEFDQSLKNLQAITNATDTEIELLGSEIKKVAVETKYGLNEVAEGATIIGQAGFSATETVSILGSAMNLAQGSMSTVSASADLLTTVIAAFNLNASDAATVADNMAAAMNYSKLDIDKLRVAFNYVGPVAMDAGLSLNEMSAALMVLANNGMKASTIGTSLRNVFSQIASPSTALKKAFEGNDEALNRLQDKTTSIVDKFTILNEVLGTSSNLYELFGLRATGTVSILMKYPQQLQAMVDGLYTLGDAERMADKQMEGLANRMKNFKAAMEVAAVTIAERPAGALSNIVKLATDTVNIFSNVMNSSLGDAIAYVTTFSTAIGGLIVGVRLLKVIFGKTIPYALSVFTAALGAKALALTTDTVALVANIKAGKAKITTITESTAATVASSAVIRANTASTVAHTAVTNADTVAMSARTKAVRALGVALTFLSKNPVILVLSALTLTLGAVTAAIEAFRQEEDKEYKASAQWMKQKREQLGIISSAIEANRNLSDNNDAIRMSNNVYVATKVPFIAEDLLANFDKDKTHDILTGAYQTIQDQLVSAASDTMIKAAQRIEDLEQGRNAIKDAFKHTLESINLEAASGKTQWVSASGNQIAYIDATPEQIADKRDAASTNFYEQMATNIKRVQSANAEMRESFDVIAESAKRTTDGLIKEYGDVGAAWEKLTGRSTTELDKGIEYIDLYTAALDQGLLGTIRKASGPLLDLIELFREASITEQKLAHSTKDADYALKELPSVLNSLHISGGDRLISTFKNVDNGMLIIAKAADKYQKTLKKLSEQQGAMSGEAYNQAVSEANIAFYDTLVKEYDKTYSRELQWIELRKKSAIAANNEMAQSEEDRIQRQKQIEAEYSAQMASEARTAITDELNILTSKAGIGQLTSEQIDIILNPDRTELDNLIKDMPLLRDILKSESMMSGITRYINLVVNASKAKAELDKLPKTRFGVVAKNNYDAAKNDFDKSISETERAYATGGISYDDYIEAKIAARQVLIAKEQKYVEALKDTIRNEADQSKYNKAFAALEENKAKAAHEAEMLRNEKAIWKVEHNHNRKMYYLDKEATALENRDMNEADRQVRLLKIDEQRIRYDMTRINTLLTSDKIKLNSQRRAELQLELDKKQLDLDKNKVEQARKLYEIRTKYIEQEYKYGLQTKQDYRNYIEKQQREGTMNPYDAQKELWRTSDSPLNGFRLGIMEVAEATQTMNDYISEGVANFRDEWHSAMDEFVESWWDGTASASEIFGDFVNNIAMDWQKRILKMYSDRMFEGFAKSFLPDSLQSTYTQFGGGRAANVTTDDGLSNPTASAVPDAQVYVGGQLVQAISATAQNVQTNINAATNSMANDVANMSNQSTSLLTSMTNGASSLWQFLANGFNGLWNNIGSGLSGLLASLSFATTASSGGSFFERWMGNSIGMGFQLVSMNMGGGQQSRVDANYKGMPAVGEAGYDALWNQMFGSAKGNVFKGISGFSNSIVSSPTLFTYGEHLKAFAKGEGLMGEAGPEAIMPLTRDGSGRLGVNASGMSPCINNIYIETPEGYTAEQTSRMSNDNGGEDIMFTIVKQTAANVAQPGSPMYRAMQNTFGASQVLTSR